MQSSNKLPGVEVGRYPNRGAYSLLYDAGSDEWVLYNIPVTSPTSGAPPGWRRDDTSGIYANPGGGANEQLAPPGGGLPRLMGTVDVFGGKPPEERRAGTLDAAFHQRAVRLISAERVRGINDANRKFYGQPPLTGRPGR